MAKTKTNAKVKETSKPQMSPSDGNKGKKGGTGGTRRQSRSLDILIIKEVDWKDSKYRTRKWEKTVDIKRWEHDYELKQYVIDYDEIQ